MAYRSARCFEVLESEDYFKKIAKHVGTEVVGSAEDIAKQEGSEGKHDGSEGKHTDIWRM